MQGIKRHPQAVALDKWLESDDGKRCINDSLLRHSKDSYYLENRIKTAFAAGWEAAEENTKQPKRSPGKGRKV